MIFEVSEEDFRRSFWRRTRLMQFAGSALGLILVPFFALMIGLTEPLGLTRFGALSAVYLLLIWIVVRKRREVRRLNRIGIYTSGLAPGRKPVSARGRPSRLVLPYDSINTIEFWTVGPRDAPDAPFGTEILLKDGTKVTIDISELIDQTRGDKEAVTRAKEILDALAHDFTGWRRAEHQGPFVFKGPQQEEQPRRAQGKKELHDRVH